jgi:hypothetical protein
MTMPKSLKYRKNKAEVGFNRMDPIFRAVDNTWNLAAGTVRETVAPHPPTEWAPWTYTLTYEFAITVGINQKTLRGHVHYTPQGNGYKAGPGYYWVEGLDNYDARTPNAIVARFRDRNVELEASGLAAMTL